MYKRLTKEYQYDCNLCKSRQCTTDKFCIDRVDCNLYNRLAELEDKFENGTLVELPCKVGDVIYQFDNGGRIYEATILNIEIHKGKPYYGTCGVDFDNTAIGESIFLTKAEAEQKLKELKGEV